MKRFFIAILLFVCVGVLQAQDPSVNKVKAIADAMSVVRGQEFDVPVRINSGTGNVFSASFTLNYGDTFPLDAILVTPGSFLGADTLFYYRIDDARSNVYVSITCRRGAPGSTGIGTLATVRFRANTARLGVRTVTLNINDIDVRDSSTTRRSISAASSSFTMADIFVWPGDLNADGIANEADVLEIGSFFNKTGASRPNASFVWKAQPASLWSGADSSVAPVDATGDGRVGMSDLAPIGFNYGLTHSIVPTISLPKLKNADGLLYANVSMLRDTAVVHIMAQAQNLLGIACQISYSPTEVSYVDAAVGTAMVSGITFTRHDSVGVVALAATRTREQGAVSGIANVMTLRFKVLANTLAMQFSGAVGRGANGSNQELEFKDIHWPGEQFTPPVPNAYQLSQNYPNPFNPATTIWFTVERDGLATLELYNLLGQRVVTLFNSLTRAGVVNTVQVDGAQFASGVYIYRLQAGSFVQAKKMILAK